MKRQITAKVLIILALVLGIAASVQGIRYALTPTLNDCGEVPASIKDALIILASVIPLLLLAVYLLLKPPHKTKWVVLATFGMIMMFVLALFVPWLLSWRTFCIPF